MGIGSKIGQAVVRKVRKAVTPEAEQLELTPRQTRVKPATEAQTVTGNVAEKARAGGIGTGRVEGGVYVGGAAAGAEATRRIMDSDSTAASDADIDRDTRINPADFPTYRKGSKSAKQFQQSHAIAKKSGAKTFTWGLTGKKYKT